MAHHDINARRAAGRLAREGWLDGRRDPGEDARAPLRAELCNALYHALTRADRRLAFQALLDATRCYGMLGHWPAEHVREAYEAAQDRVERMLGIGEEV